MFKLKIILHKDITGHELDEIIRIKSIAWPYSKQSQLEWINSNLKDSDIHLLLMKDDTAVAYLNLIAIQIEIDYINYQALGVGNVCSTEKGKGYGKTLMEKTNLYINNINKLGLLFCKVNLVNFYLKCGWSIVDKRLFIVPFENKSIETLILNYNKAFSRIKYVEKLF